MRELCRASCGDIENILVKLRTKANDDIKQQEELERREQRQKDFEHLIKQRQADREKAEQSIDAKIFGGEQVQNVSAVPAVTVAQRPFASKMSGKFGRPGEPDISLAQRPDRPADARPNDGRFTRAPFAAGRSNLPGRTWTPGQATAGGYLAKRQFTGRTPRPAAAAGTGFGLPKPTEKFVPKTNTFDNKKRGKGSYQSEDRISMDKRALLRRGIIEEQEIEERMLTRIFKTKKSKENADKVKVEKSNTVVVDADLTVKTLSEKIGKPVNQIIKQLMVLGEMCTINSVISFDIAELVSAEFGIKIERGNKKTFEEKMSAIHVVEQTGEKLQPRPPVVTIMGHVDHGKTTLLDKLRNSNVAAGESGGITQHIGAYQVEVAGGRKVTFLDTPGHAAFDKMRARGAKITDIAILIVAGDDGVMPQTVEAIHHIQGQGLPMIVAVNKCDKKGFDLEKVRNQLSENNVIGEEWGGNTIIVPISAANGTGIDKLLEMILLVADMNNYRANYDKAASGAIIEAKLDVTKGPVVTVLVRNGTLRVGDTLLAGTTGGKVRVMKDDRNLTVKEATPGMPVQITGFNEVPNAGDSVYVVDDRLTKQVIAERKGKEKTVKANAGIFTPGFDPFAEMRRTDKKQLNIILKADVSGSIEAIEQAIKNITSDEVNVNIISRGVGAVTDNDIDLASVADALVIAFNIKMSPATVKNAEKLKIAIHNFNIIYEIFDFVTERMVRLFSPKFEMEYYGKVEVRMLFKSSSIGQIAGCMVTDGKVGRNDTVILLRGKENLGQFKIDSLNIKTEDQKEIAKGCECGIKLKDAPELHVGDVFEVVGERQLPIIFNGKEYK
jgi:translation initiation factor IF-2